MRTRGYADTDRIRTKNNMSPPPPTPMVGEGGGDIILLHLALWFLRKKCLKVWRKDCLKAGADTFCGKNDAKRKPYTVIYLL